MLAADSMLRSSTFGLEVKGLRRIRRPRRADGVGLGLGQRSATQGRSTQGRMADALRWVGCFRDPVVKGKKLEAEPVRGGEDLWDAASPAAQQGRFPEHLVVMVNGLVGSAEDWRFAAEQFVRKLPDKVFVHPGSECNSSRLTFDGVDLMGERLAEEVISVVKSRKGIRKISFVAHSLGGLVARYAIGRLYETTTPMGSSLGTEDHKDEGMYMLGRIGGLEPMNFITFASPHLGSRGNKQVLLYLFVNQCILGIFGIDLVYLIRILRSWVVMYTSALYISKYLNFQLPFLCGLPFLERRASEAAHLIVGRTGKHLFLTDNDNGKPPLLLRMVDDCDDIKFRSALRCFKRRVAYANANFDHMVGWRTSSIRRQRELPKHHLLVNDNNYPHIVYVDKGDVKNHNEVSTTVEAPRDELEEEMIGGLTQVPWERVDVSFQKSRQRYIAHNTIQVKSYWLNSDGEDVIFHMIDNFLV